MSRHSSIGIQPTTATRREKTDTKESCEKDSLPSISMSLSSILQQNAATLLPTAIVKIQTKEGKRLARCLLDTASRMSWISKKFADKLNLTTLELDNEIICPVTFWSCVDSNYKLKATLRVNNRISTTTPKKSLPESIKSNFQNLILADSNFYKSSAIDIVVGVDIYSRIVLDGIYIKTGLPTAQNTAFGMILYGTFSP